MASPAPTVKPSRPAVKPYRPLLHAAAPGPYQPARVGVYHLPLDATPEALLLHFSQFGRVEDVWISPEPTTISATVQFEDEQAARSAAQHAFHQMGRHSVLVLRLHRRELPARPFPGMDPLSSPVRQALLMESIRAFAEAVGA